LIEGCKLLAY